MKHLIMVVPVLLCSCSMRTFYPTFGGVVGGAAGALGGPVTAAAGAGAGVLTGELMKGNEDLKEATDTIKSLTKGDVEALLAAGMGKQKGFVENAIDAVMDTIKLVCSGLILWNVVPIIYTRYVHRKTNANGTTKKTEG